MTLEIQVLAWDRYNKYVFIPIIYTLVTVIIIIFTILNNSTTGLIGLLTRLCIAV